MYKIEQTEKVNIILVIFEIILLIYNKVIMIKLLIILLFSPLLGDDDAGYRFVNEIETKESIRISY